jgi:hypothetical protein
MTSGWTYDAANAVVLRSDCDQLKSGSVTDVKVIRVRLIDHTTGGAAARRFDRRALSGRSGANETADATRPACGAPPIGLDHAARPSAEADLDATVRGELRAVPARRSSTVSGPAAVATASTRSRPRARSTESPRRARAKHGVRERARCRFVDGALGSVPRVCRIWKAHALLARFLEDERPRVALPRRVDLGPTEARAHERVGSSIAATVARVSNASQHHYARSVRQRELERHGERLPEAVEVVPAGRG